MEMSRQGAPCNEPAERPTKPTASSRGSKPRDHGPGAGTQEPIGDRETNKGEKNKGNNTNQTGTGHERHRGTEQTKDP